MKAAVLFLAVDDVQIIHDRMIREFGGKATLRDAGLLASAVAMPTAQFEGRFLHDGLAAMAAAYLFHLCQNHPFMDGNKRTAPATAEVFLLVNGARLAATNKQLEQLTLDVVSGNIGKEEVVKFFKKSVRK